MLRIAIYANCFVYAWVAVALFRGLAAVFLNPEWETLHAPGLRVAYAALQIMFLAITLACLGGLLFRREWSRQLAVPWNLGLAAVLGVVPPLAIALTLGTDWLRQLANGETVVKLALAVLLVLLAIRLRTATAKAYFGDANAKPV